MTAPNRKKIIALSLGAAALIAFLLYGGYRYLELRKEKISLDKKISELEDDIGKLRESLASTQTDLENARGANDNLTRALEAEQNKNSSFEAQIKDISGTVSSLQKLSELDPQLLKKYSRVYFLSENYSPAQLSSIGSQYIYDKNKPQLIHPGVLPYLSAMLASAEREGVKLRVISGYRSFYEQGYLKQNYTMTFGNGANQFSADQGYSEHQLGTAVDLATPEIGDSFSKFGKSDAYKWLASNAYKYGFALSYPQGNSYYQYEPWHWRFVGVSLATKLHDGNEYFYNLSQREIDQYLISIFD